MLNKNIQIKQTLKLKIIEINLNKFWKIRNFPSGRREKARAVESSGAWPNDYIRA